MSGSGERLPTWVGESGRGGDDDGENEQVDGVNNRDGSDRSSSSGHGQAMFVELLSTTSRAHDQFVKVVYRQIKRGVLFNSNSNSIYLSSRPNKTKYIRELICL